MTRHTKGPWTHWHGGIYACAEGPIHNGETCEECGHHPSECGDAVIITLDSEIVRDVKAGHWDDCADPLAADLRMMAAAPELLEALVSLLSQSGYQSMDDANLAYEAAEGNQGIPAIQKARAAIAKATGAAQ